MDDNHDNDSTTNASSTTPRRHGGVKDTTDEGEDYGGEFVPISQTVRSSFAIVITGCQSLDSTILAGAAVLLHTIQEHHADYEAFAIIHDTEVIQACRDVLQRIGYTVLPKPIPVNVRNTTNPDFEKFVKGAGCCGDAEFLKLWVYTLPVPAVAYADIDVMVLQNLDHLFELLVDGKVPKEREYSISQQDIAIDPPSISALWTRDYSQTSQQRRWPPEIRNLPIQGGFFMVKTSQQDFDELVSIVNSGNYTRDHGWMGEMKTGAYWGMPQIQGLFAYYYGYRHPDRSLELNYCHYNTLIADPYFQDRCITQQSQCEDCRDTPIGQIVVAHPIFCLKPWQCARWEDPGAKRTRPCQILMNKWHSTRARVEQIWIDQSRNWELSPTTGNLQFNMTLGYCYTNRTFVPMRFQPDSLLSTAG